jgi:hypothetical protein
LRATTAQNPLCAIMVAASIQNENAGEAVAAGFFS